MGHFCEVARKLNIDEEQANNIIAEIESTVRNWPEYAKRANVEKPTITRLSKIFENITI